MEMSTSNQCARVARSGTWFASLPDDLASRLLAEGRFLKLPAGTRLFARGDPPDGIYCVLNGVVRISTIAENGKEVILAMLVETQWFGEIALFDGEPRTHDAWAEGECALLRVPQASLLRMLAERPAHWMDLGRLLTQKLRITFAGLEEIALLPPTARLAGRLTTMAGAYGTWTDRSKRVLEISQEQLGLMLSLSRQTVNQSLKELEAGGSIRRNRGSIEIADLEKLIKAKGSVG
ncbi:MAG: catabolite activator [Pseudomonadota bacterium]|jgi:CRP-like cAMP-binding protein